MAKEINKTCLLSKTIQVWDKNHAWNIQAVIDFDGDLNLYITNPDNAKAIITEVESGQGDGIKEQLALRFVQK